MYETNLNKTLDEMDIKFRNEIDYYINSIWFDCLCCDIAA